jgi:predicted nucleic acid-binding protein
MTLIDTGPLVALFDPKDPDHKACHRVLEDMVGALHTTEAVLTEVFHMLGAGSRAARGIQQFLLDGYVSLLPLDRDGLARCFEYMEQYHDLPMDFADATLLVAAESLRTRRVLTLDFADFAVYRIRRGHRLYPMDLIGRDQIE